MGRVDDLTAFLTARLDEDEAAAKAVKDRHWAMATIPGGELAPGVVAHIARHDPARVLREVAAGRTILAACQDSGEGSIVRDALRYAVNVFTAVYSDHPDYRAEWKP